MKDNRVIALQFKILNDHKLSDGAKVMGVQVCSHVWKSKEIYCEEDFPLPWTLAAKLCGGISQSETYYRLHELKVKHLKHEGVKGCPGQAYFRLVLPEAKAY